MKYYVSAAERWMFWETSIYEKDSQQLTVEYSCKWGTVVVDVPEDHKFDIDFESIDYDDWYILDSGDEQLESISLDGMGAAHIVDDMDRDEYFDEREYLEEELGWEYVESTVYITKIIVEKADENV